MWSFKISPKLNRSSNKKHHVQFQFWPFQCLCGLDHYSSKPVWKCQAQVSYLQVAWTKAFATDSQVKSPRDTGSPEKRKSKNIALFPSYRFMAHKMKTLENGVCKLSHFATQNKIGFIPLYRCFGINMRLKKKHALLTYAVESGLIMLHFCHFIYQNICIIA